MVELVIAALINAPSGDTCSSKLITPPEVRVRNLVGEGVRDFSLELTRQISEMRKPSREELNEIKSSQSVSEFKAANLSTYTDPIGEGQGMFALLSNSDESIFMNKSPVRLQYDLDYHRVTLGLTAQNLDLIADLAAQISFIANNLDIESLQATIDSRSELHQYSFGKQSAVLHFTELMKTIVTMTSSLTAGHQITQFDSKIVLQSLWLPQESRRFSVMDILAVHFPPAYIGRLLPVYSLRDPTHLEANGEISLSSDFLKKLRHVRDLWNQKEEQRGRNLFETGRGCPVARCFGDEDQTPITQLLEAILHRI